MPKLDSLSNLLLTALDLLLDALRFIRLSLPPHCAVAAENLFLHKQLANPLSEWGGNGIVLGPFV